MKEYQREFIDFMIESEALRFGEFKLKSGRTSPHFFNSAQFNDGKRIAKLADFYAQHIIESIGRKCKSVFGPAYKGIPLATSTALTLAEKYHYPIGYTFNRKEVKDHGDGGELVGTQLLPGMPIVIVEDVVTAGTTLKEIVPLIREKYQSDIKGVIISLDRCERGADSSCSAKDEAERDLGIKIFPLVTIYEIINHIEEESMLSQYHPHIPSIRAYLKEYGTPPSAL